MIPYKLKFIIGSTRQNRASEKVAPWIESVAKSRSAFDVEVLDLRDYPLPFFNEAQTPSSKKEPYKDPIVAKWTAKIAEGDAFIIIAPEYNHGYPAVLKNALDWVYQEWNNKPIGFVTYGSALGARAIEQLRLVAIELQMAPIRSAIHLPTDVAMAIWAGKVTAETFKPLEEKARVFMDQLLWWTGALVDARGGGAIGSAPSAIRDILANTNK